MDQRAGRGPAEDGADAVDLADDPADDGAGDPADDTAGDPADDRPGDPADDAAGDPADDAAGDAGDEAPAGRDPRRFNEWRKRSATGVVMSGIALGLQEALELPRERPALVIEAPGEPDDPDNPIDLRFDPDDPGGTVAIVRQRGDGDAAAPPARS